MNEPIEVSRTSWLAVSLRIAFVFLAVTGFVAGYVGLSAFIPTLPAGARDSVSTDPVSLTYYTLQLFVLSSQPLQLAGHYSLPLAYAIFAAPAGSAIALVEAGRALFEAQVRRWRARHRNGHAIVVGHTPMGRALVTELGRRNVVWTPHGSIEDLLAAGIRGAKTVYACANDYDGDSTLNVHIAQTAASAARKSNAGALTVYAQVTDPALALGMQARWLSRPPQNADVDFFTLDILAARACLRPGDFPDPRQGNPRLVIAGWGTFGQALLVEYAQRWRVESGRTDAGRIAVTVVGEPGQSRQAIDIGVREVAQRWDVIAEMCDVTSVDDTAAPWRSDGPLPHRTFICYEDETLALTTALHASRLWRGEPDSIVVRLNRLALTSVRGGGRRPDRTTPPLLIDDIGGRLRLVSVTELACRPAAISREDLVERLAQSIHRRYLLARFAEGAALNSTNAIRPWDDLTEGYRHANRQSARNIGRRLAMIGASVAPRTGVAIGVDFAESEYLRLSQDEHERWYAEREAAGWRYGPERDEDRLLNPSMVPWSELPDHQKVKDFEAIRDMSVVLADVGLEIVRVGPPASRDEAVLPDGVSVSA